jgi:hypothetical protein
VVTDGVIIRNLVTVHGFRTDPAINDSHDLMVSLILFSDFISTLLEFIDPFSPGLGNTGQLDEVESVSL